MKKIIIFLSFITIMVGLIVIIVRPILGDPDDKVESDIKYIVINPPEITSGLQDMREKVEYPQMDYKYLNDTELSFYTDNTTYVERTGEFQFYIDEECKTQISVKPVFISSEIVKSGDSYAVLAEENRVLYFPSGDKIPHLVSR